MKKQISKNQYIVKNYAFVFIGCVIFSLLFKWIQTGNPFSSETLLFFVTSYVISVFTGLWAIQFFKYFSKKTQKEIAKQFIPALLIFWIGFLCISIVTVSLGVLAFFYFSNFDLKPYFPHFINVELFPLLKMIAFWAFLGSIVFIYILWRKAIDREQKLKEENLIFRYETIKGQVNPHFLFNSLNTLSSLVRTNPDVAEEYINKLASIYRYILDNVQSNHVPLQVEIAFVNDYFSLHKIRDGEKIQLNIQLNDINKYKVLPISLQILIENAIKHNMATRESPLYISLQYEDGYIVVKNNLQKMVNLGRSSGNGLKNLQERIVLLTNRTLIINETINEFIVKLPIIATNENINN